MVQIQEIVGLLGGATTSMLEVLALVRLKLQQDATEVREDLTMDIVLTLEDLDNPVPTHFGHALRLTASSFNSF